MSRNLLRLIAFFLIFLLFLSRVNRALALSSLADEFSDLPIDTSMWHIDLNGGNAGVEDGSLLLSASPGSTYPYLYLENGPSYLNGDFTFEIRFKFYGFQNYGYGIVLADKLLLNGVPDPLGLSDFVFAIWPLGESTHSFSLTTILCSSSSTTCNDYSLATTAGWDSWHTIKIMRSGQVYYAYLDGDLIFESKPTSKAISQLWLGNPQSTGGVTWGGLLIDYIRINTTTPAPEALRPVVIVPGHQASWNYVQMLGLPGDNVWKIPSFINLYDNLINSLKNAGYQEGVNLFVYGYDWRKTIGDAADDLKSFVDGLGLTEKIDFISHSYGGLMTRGYAQEWGTDKVNKILEVGSPNLGTVNAYGAWEGGVFWNTKWWQKGIMEMLIHINKIDGGPILETKIDTIRRVAPSIRDTLPTFDYLVRDGVMLPETLMLQRNGGLPGLNDSIGGVDSLLKVIGGTGKETIRKINTIERNVIETAFGLWEDGKPVTDNPFVFSSGGDDTVLALSAAGPFSNTSLINQNHGGLVSSREGIEKIFDELGLDKTKVIATTSADTRERVLVVMLRSPGTLHVCAVLICDGDLGIYLPDQKLFMWPDFDDVNLSVSVEANGETGSYKLVSGKIDERGANWREMDGSLDSTSETDSYLLTALFDATAPVITPYLSPEPNAAGWNNSDVTVTWTVNDPESAIISSTGCGITVVDTETPGTNITCTATSNGGSSSATVTVKLDKTKPEITMIAPFDGAVYTVGQVINANYDCTDTLSDVAGCNGGVADGDAINTSSGLKEFIVIATDNADNEASVRVEYGVGYTFSGFGTPITIPAKKFKGTSTIPLKFTLLDYFGSPFPDAWATLEVCNLIGVCEPAVSSGFANIGNVFRYDFLTNQYIFNLSTKMLSLGGNVLRVDLDGDTSHTATIIIK